MRYCFAIFLLLLLSGCAKVTKSSDEPGGNPYAALFKLWTEPDTYHQIDMRAAHFGQTSLTVTVNGKTCECKLLVSGFIDKGELEIRLCALDGVSSDVDCDATNLERTYELQNNSLRICEKNSGPCSYYYSYN